MTANPAPPLPLDRFSPRAQRLLLRAQRLEVERDRAEIARRLTACGRPALTAAIDFECALGGLRWGDQDCWNTLRIWYTPPRDPESHPLGEQEWTMVPIGSVAGEWDSEAYIDETGQVFTTWLRKSSSIWSYLEQAAMEVIVDWPTWFHVTVRPPVGPPLSEALGLSLVAAATDAYQAWWTSESIEMRHMRFYDPRANESMVDWFHARSLDDAVRIFEAAEWLSPGIGVSLSRYGGTTFTGLTPAEVAEIPPIDSWRDVPGAVRYPLGFMWEDLAGVLWVLGAPGARRIEEYITSVESGELRSWTTYEGSDETARCL